MEIEENKVAQILMGEIKQRKRICFRREQTLLTVFVLLMLGNGSLAAIN